MAELTAPEDAVLQTLRRYEVPMTVRDLADIQGLSVIGTRSAVATLVRLGMVEAAGVDSDGWTTFRPLAEGVTPAPIFRGPCRHPWIARRVGDWPAYWICSDCGQNFRNGREPRQHPVDPPSVERDGEPTGAV
jgi:hypothetical protein